MRINPLYKSESIMTALLCFSLSIPDTSASKNFQAPVSFIFPRETARILISSTVIGIANFTFIRLESVNPGDPVSSPKTEKRVIANRQSATT